MCAEETRRRSLSLRRLMSVPKVSSPATTAQNGRPVWSSEERQYRPAQENGVPSVFTEWLCDVAYRGDMLSRGHCKFNNTKWCMSDRNRERSGRMATVLAFFRCLTRRRFTVVMGPQTAVSAFLARKLR